MATSSNTVSSNLIQNLSEWDGYGIGVILYNNFYADVTGNVIQNVHGGVQTGNFSRANPGTSGSIDDNVISASSFGISSKLDVWCPRRRSPPFKGTPFPR